MCPAIVDLAAMRDAIDELGSDPAKINPLVPVDLVIDHSVQVDAFGNPRAFDINADRDYERNRERYAFLRWGQQAFDNFRVVPPATGICHQVNLEYLGQVVFSRESPTGVVQAYPDTLVGTDSHTTMVNGLGVLGWGVGGIEAEAAMLGQPISMLLPQVVGFRLDGELPEGATATDLVLTVTEMLRERGVVSKFVEFFGPGLTRSGSPTGRRSATCRRSSARPARSSRSTARRCATSSSPGGRPRRSSSSTPTRASRACSTTPTPRTRPSPRRSSSTSPRSSPRSRARSAPRTGSRSQNAKPAFIESLAEFDPEAAEALGNGVDEAIGESFPASDPPAEDHADERGRPRVFEPAASGESLAAIAEHKATPVVVEARGRRARSSSTTAGS